MAYSCGTQQVRPEQNEDVTQPRQRSRLLLPSVREVQGPPGPSGKGSGCKQEEACVHGEAEGFNGDEAETQDDEVCVRSAADMLLLSKTRQEHLKAFAVEAGAITSQFQ